MFGPQFTKRMLWAVGVFIVLGFGTSLLLYWFGSSSLRQSFFFGYMILFHIVFFLSVFVVFPLGVIYYVIHSGERQRALMKTFAKEKGFSYRNSAPVSSVSGRLFAVSKTQTKKLPQEKQESAPAFFKTFLRMLYSIQNVISGTCKGYPVRIFYFYYRVKGEKSNTQRFTVSEITVEGADFPFILLQSQSMSRYTPRDFSGEDKDIHVNIGSKFDKAFTLYSEQNYEIEALQIFTDEYLYFLQEHAPNFSIEFGGDRMYIYDDEIITTKEELEEFFEIMKQIIVLSGPFLKRMRDDFKVLHEVYRK